jgi:hypothetical protein
MPSTPPASAGGLPTYDLGPGHARDEVIVNVVLYAAVLALLLCLLWIALLFVQAVRESKRPQS